MYIDSQEIFSEAQSIISAVGDVVSTNVYDAGAASDIGNGEEMFVYVKTNAAVVGAGSSVQVVLQHSVDNATWADLATAPVVGATQAIANTVLARFAVPIGTRRYLRLAYRISGGATSAGSVSGYLVLDPQYNVAYRSAISAV